MLLWGVPGKESGKNRLSFFPSPFLRAMAAVCYRRLAMAIEAFELQEPDTTNTVEFKIMNIESLNQQWGLDESRVTVQYRIPWDKRFLARDLLLGRTTVETIPRIHLSRILPHEWIEDEEGSNIAERKLFAARITNTRGYGTRTEPDCYDEAIITVIYEDLDYFLAEDYEILTTQGEGESATEAPDESLLKRYVELAERSYEGRIIQAYGTGARYAEADGTINNAISRPVMQGAPFPHYEESFTLVWHQVPIEIVPWSRISAMTNKINSVSFGDADLGGIHAIRTLMFVGCKPVFTRLPNQARAVNLHYKFKKNRRRWDYLPDPSRQNEWFRVVMNSDNTKTLFEEDDFAKLFKPL